MFKLTEENKRNWKIMMGRDENEPWDDFVKWYFARPIDGD